MWINSFDSDEGIDLSGKVSESASEQYSEKAKKAQSQLKKIQKDEKMAQWDNQKLFLILARFINDPYYEKLIKNIVSLLQIGTPSRAVIALISLFYPDATFFVVDSLWKKEKMNLLLSLPRNENLENFDEKNVHPAISGWMSEWIVLMEAFLVMPESSILMLKKFLEIISGNDLKLVEQSLSELLIFFFHSRNISINHSTAENYARFIVKNVRDNIQKYLHSQNQNVQELIADATIDANDLF